MKKILFLIGIFTVFLSCSSDETSVSVNPPSSPIVKYTISLSAGEGGTVSTTGGVYETGQTVSVTATPQGEYVFTSWSDGNTNATRTITIGSNLTITANFEKRKYPLTINFEGEGEVLEEIVNAGRTTEYDSGTTVKLTAQASAEWVFVGWTGDIESTEESVQIVIGEPKEVTANFEKKKYPLTVNIEGEGEVIEEIIEAGRTTDYDSGTTVKLTAEPSDEWLFTGWSGEIGDIDPTENPIQLNISESKNVTANFSIDINNYFKIGDSKFSISRVSGDDYLNSLTCDGVPSFFNHDLTFYSQSEDHGIYIEFFNNNSDQFSSGEYTSLFSYLNLFFQNNFNDMEDLEDHIDTLSNQELYDFYSTLCSFNDYKVVGSVRVINQNTNYSIDKEVDFQLTVNLSDDNYIISMTGFIENGGEKIELFFSGSLDFEIKIDNNQPDEINDFLSSNNQNSYDLNLLYDSNFNLDGTFKTEESVISSTRPLYLIDDNLLYYLRSYNSIQSKLFTSNNNYLDFDADDGDPYTYPDYLEGNIIKNDEEYFNIFLIDTYNPPIYKFGKRRLNYDRLESLSEIIIDLTDFGPDEYNSKTFNFSNFFGDNSNILFLNIQMRVVDVYGDIQFSNHFIKYSIEDQKIIWSIENTDSEYRENTNIKLFNNNQNVISYGFDKTNYSTWYKIYDSNTGEMIQDKILTTFNPINQFVLNGFYEESNYLILFGEYGYIYKINKSSYTHNTMYTYTYGDPDYCYQLPKVSGLNKFNNNYVILSNVYKNDENEGTFSIDIRDDQGNLLNSFSIKNTGSPQHLFKLSDDSFLIVGSKEICIPASLGPQSRIIKFNLTETNNNDEKISRRFFETKKRK